MMVMSVYIVFTHQERQEEIDSWVDYSFSREMLRQAFFYYRWIGVSMIVIYVLFTISCLLLQAEGYVIFTRRQDAGGRPARSRHRSSPSI